MSGESGHTICFTALLNCLRAFPWLSWGQFYEAACYYDATKCYPPFGRHKNGIDHKAEDVWRIVKGG